MIISNPAPYTINLSMKKDVRLIANKSFNSPSNIPAKENISIFSLAFITPMYGTEVISKNTEMTRK